MRRLLVVLTACVFLLIPAQALAAPTEPTPTTWAVQPGNELGPNGRSWVEVQAEPGSSNGDFMVVRNLGKSKATFKLMAADGYFTESGRFNMLSSGRESVDAGSWITIPATVTVDAGQQSVVPFTLTVPQNATPGDHAAGLAATISTAGTDNAGNAVGVESRVGFRVMVRVKGEISPALQTSATVQLQTNFNPLNPGVAIVDVSLVNSGNTRLATGGTVQVSGPLGIGGVEIPLPPIEDILPGDSRSQRLAVPGVWPLFMTTAKVTVNPVAVHGQTLPVVPTAEIATARTVAIPWAQLGALMLLAAVALLYVLLGRRRRARLQDMMLRAREDGRREALDAGKVHTRANALTLWAVLAASAVLLVPPTTPGEGPNDIVIGVEIMAPTPSTSPHAPSATALPTTPISPSSPGLTSMPSGTPHPTISLPMTGMQAGTLTVLASALVVLALGVLALRRGKGRRS